MPFKGHQAKQDAAANHFLLTTFQRLINEDLFMLASHITVSRDLAWVRANMDELTEYVVKHSDIARRLGPVVALNLQPAQAMITA
jgi:hypothetical protein